VHAFGFCGQGFELGPIMGGIVAQMARPTGRSPPSLRTASERRPRPVARCCSRPAEGVAGMCIAVLGGGAIGLGTAALLIERGDQPVLWSRSGHAASLEVSGALAGHYAIPAAPSIADAVAEADAILLALPANGHRAVIDAVAPHLRVGQAAIVSGQLSFGALYLAKRLAERSMSIPITAWGTTVVTGRRTGPASLRIGSIRAQVDPDAHGTWRGLATERQHH
jgi:hypothetical protein